MLKIYGSSDDNVYANIELQRKCPTCGTEIDEPSQSVVCDTEDEIGAYGRATVFTIGDSDAGLIVEMRYEGVWSAKIRQIEEDVLIPWPVSIESEGYTAIVKIDCPNGTLVGIKGRDIDD
jgi:hypothetical protein